MAFWSFPAEDRNGVQRLSPRCHSLAPIVQKEGPLKAFPGTLPPRRLRPGGQLEVFCRFAGLDLPAGSALVAELAAESEGLGVVDLVSAPFSFSSVAGRQAARPEARPGGSGGRGAEPETRAALPRPRPGPPRVAASCSKASVPTLSCPPARLPGVERPHGPRGDSFRFLFTLSRGFGLKLMPLSLELGSGSRGRAAAACDLMLIMPTNGSGTGKPDSRLGPWCRGPWCVQAWPLCCVSFAPRPLVTGLKARR